MKQTAVEQLIEKMSLQDVCKYSNQLADAKEMEKEQMQLTWNNAIDAVQKDKWESYDDFYSNNFKSE